jgi:dienelactone hydrolase
MYDFSSQAIEFSSNGETLVGSLFKPSLPSSALPAVIVTGAWRTVKEQMPSRYAAELARRGYMALAFDFRGWGDSSGRPRLMENPFAKAEDIVAAANYLSQREDVTSVVGLSVCASGGYMALAATETELITSLALVAPALPNKELVVNSVGGPNGVKHILAQAAMAREAFEATGNEQLVTAVERTPATTAPGSDYYTNPDRGAIPQWPNAYNPASWEHWLEFDAQASAPTLRKPLLIVTSEEANSPESVREFVSQLPSPPEELWLDNVKQFDFYDQPDVVKTSVDAAVAHFDKTMP